jgi:hypothetical protein
MASLKLNLIHLQEIAKRQLEEEKKQTKLLVVALGLIILQIVSIVILVKG